MSRSQPLKGKITHAPRDADFDQAILVFAAAIGIALVSIWIVWNNGEDAATSFMLKQKRVQAEGLIATYKLDDVNYVLVYGYYDQNGKEWARVKLNKSYFLSTKLKASNYRKKEKLSDDELVQKFKSNIRKRKIAVWYHPDYPRFFATEEDLSGFSFNFRLTIGGFSLLLLAIFLGLRSIRKYRRLKAIAAYY